MIAFVKGILDSVSEDKIIVENQNIGFEILVPGSVVSELPQVGNTVKIYTYTYVREDALQLYGFLTKDSMDMFKLLITVNGIGPKAALGILTAMDTDALRLAILSDDAKTIAKAPGIGPKTARGPRECHESQCRVGQGRAKQKRALNRIWWPCRAKYPRSRGYFFTIN